MLSWELNAELAGGEVHSPGIRATFVWSKCRGFSRAEYSRNRLAEEIICGLSNTHENYTATSPQDGSVQSSTEEDVM
jgi:hypothetical protein